MKIDYSNIVQMQKSFFFTGKTLQFTYRRDTLQKLKNAILSNQKAIINALSSDFKRPDVEIYTSELCIVLNEIEDNLKNLKKWIRPHSHKTPLINQPGSTWQLPYPFGSVLIVGPWNYPFGLIMRPLVNAISAGNCVILKPSEFTPATAECIQSMISDSFLPELVTVVPGNPEITSRLISSNIDYLFFIGSTRTGQIVMNQCAEHLIPVTLELGGKNPCIVCPDCNLKTAARRITWGKFFNAGQTCVAPDFVLIPRTKHREFIIYLKKSIQSMYGCDPLRSPDYARIINDSHFDRLQKLIRCGQVVTGGKCIRKQKYISPTVMTNVKWNSPLMQEEIFGPILPVIIYDSFDEIINYLNTHPSPLAIYCFSNDSYLRKRIEQETKSGNICYNGTLHLMIARGLPFGGTGYSGMGRYGGKAGFDQFSYIRCIMKKYSALEFPLLYPPYRFSWELISSLRRLLF